MEQQGKEERARESAPAGQQCPPRTGGEVSADHPQSQQPQQAGGGGAPGTGQEDLVPSPEAANQEETSRQSRAVSGTTAPSRL